MKVIIFIYCIYLIIKEEKCLVIEYKAVCFSITVFVIEMYINIHKYFMFYTLKQLKLYSLVAFDVKRSFWRLKYLRFKIRGFSFKLRLQIFLRRGTRTRGS